MIIRDILNLKGSTLHSIAPAGRIADAVSTMVKHDIGSLVVMDGGKMVGMLTFREVLRALESNAGSLADLQCGAFMVADPVCGTPEETLEHVREVMIQNHIRYLPVKQDQQLLGVISFHDIAKAVIKQTSFENRLLKRYIKNWPEAEEPLK